MTSSFTEITDVIICYPDCEWEKNFQKMTLGKIPQGQGMAVDNTGPLLVAQVASTGSWLE